jgi:CTP:molybdopterin cytidylyltransferase MocA
MNLSAVILAGGESRRMGTDKAWLSVSGQPLLSRAFGTVRELGAAEVFISGRCHVVVHQFRAQSRYAVRDFAAACQLRGLVRAYAVSSDDAGCFVKRNRPSDVA